MRYDVTVSGDWGVHMNVSIRVFVRVIYFPTNVLLYTTQKHLKTGDVSFDYSAHVFFMCRPSIIELWCV